MSETRLAKAARETEEVALGLHSFKDALPEDRTYIASIIGKLYEINSLFSRLDKASLHPQFEPSFFRVKQDVVNVVYSVQATHRLAFDMFGRTRTASQPRVWDDLIHRMTSIEGVPYHERLDWYKSSLGCCIAVLKEQPCPGRNVFYERIIDLLRGQQPVAGAFGRADAPRYAEEPRSPSLRSDGSRGTYPWAPEPPLVSPISSSSRDTFESSQTSYSSLGLASRQGTAHWAKDVFNGQYASSAFRRSFCSPDATRCDGDVMSDALDRLLDDGYAAALEVKFEDGEVRVHFFHRATDDRARILYISPGKRVHCAALTNLRIVRDKSCLKLCHAVPTDSGIKLRLWANLNFATFERMCLFYSTFVAMKRQDSNGVAHRALLEEADELDELEPFGGKIKDRNMIHALHLRRERGSGVVRLEATPYRGPMAGVPLWTAFVTKFKQKADVHWAEHIGKGVVSLAALKPGPYVFLPDYLPPHNRKEWLLHFLEVQDAKDFCTAWTKLCRQSD